MWPFSRSKSDAEKVTEIMDEVIDTVASKWIYFSETLQFKAEVSLQERMFAFAVPAIEGMKKKYEILKRTPEPLLLIFVAKGVEKSGTDSREEIEKAMGAPLP